jgi:hypothetical protein
MNHYSQNGFRAAAGLALTLGLGAIIAPAAQAQTLKPERPISLKIGGYFPVRKGFSDATNDVLWAAGASFDFFKTPGGNATVAGVYLDGAFYDSSSRDGSLVGLGVQGRTYLRGIAATSGLYALYGVGSYYQYAKSSGFSTSEWRFGGKLGFGLDTGSRLFFEATYTSIDGGKLDGDGIQAFVGLRF